MYDPALFLESLADFTAQQLLAPYDVQSALDGLAQRVTEVLGLSGSGVSLANRDRLVFQAASDSGIALLGCVQEQRQSGPCVDAHRSGQVVAVEEVAQERSRWPAYCERAAEVGVTAVASVPMTLGGQTLGVLGLYSRESRDWPEPDLAAALAMANMATAFLVHGEHDRKQVERNEQLQQALDNRIVIEQAKGFLAASLGISLDEAFQQLRRYARGHRVKVREAAEAVVRDRLEL